MMRDEPAMQRALALAEAARSRTPPWPWVGCVLVRDGVVVGEAGTGSFPEGPHAEVGALRAARASARGSTAFTTLEPCDHHGNTPPCTEALVSAGVARVVVALVDPDPKVSGRGIDRLRASGIEVDVGVGAAPAAESLRAYLRHRRSGRPLVLAKIAASLDGRVAAADRSSQWITGPAARADAHRLRAESQAVVVGSGTALADAPALTVRDAPAPLLPPLRVVLDGRGRVPATGALFDARSPTLVVTTASSPPRTRRAWQTAGAEVEVVAPGSVGVDPGAVLDALGARGVLQALIEGGPTVLASFVGAGLVDELVVYLAPTALGPHGLTGWGHEGPASMSEAPRWRIRSVAAVGPDLKLHVDVRGDDPPVT